jgi:hypothetical protein
LIESGNKLFTYLKFDEFIPDYYQHTIEDYMTKAPVWGFSSNVSGRDERSFSLPDGLEIAENQYGLGSSVFLESDRSSTDEKLYAMLQPMINKIRLLFPIELAVHRVRGGMMTRHSDNKLHIPHSDYHFPHYTFLYYVNDSDGDTFLFNEKVTPFVKGIDYPDNFSLLERFSPKKGSAIIFNGLHYHSSSTPVDHDSRIAININLVPLDEQGNPAV